MTVAEIKSKLLFIRTNLASAENEQGLLNDVYTRDFHNAVNLQTRIDLWVVSKLALVLITGAFQVLMVKGLFDSKYTVKRFMK